MQRLLAARRRWVGLVLVVALAATLAACTGTTTGPTTPPITVGMTYQAANDALRQWCEDLDINVDPGIPPGADLNQLYVAGQSYTKPPVVVERGPGPPSPGVRVAPAPQVAATVTPSTTRASAPGPAPTTCADGHHVVTLRLYTTVSKLERLTFTQARDVLHKQGLDLAPVTARDTKLVVRSQKPTTGTRVPIDALPYASQKVTVELGVEVPDVTNMIEDAACESIVEAGLVCLVNPLRNGQQRGSVTGQDPPGKRIVEPGTRVTITVLRQAIDITVPNVVGQFTDAACATLTASTLTCDQPSPAAGGESGTVVGQQPEAGTKVAAGTRVTLQIRQTSPSVTVPDVVGKTEEAACQELLGIKLICTRKIIQEGDPPGTVIAQDPEAGSATQPGSPVVVQVRRQHKVTVPDVVGRAGDQACQPIQDAQLVCIPDQPGGTGNVVSQNPAPGALVDEGTQVTLILASSPNGVTVPGWLIAAALAVLVIAGAVIRLLIRPGSSPPDPPTAGSLNVRLVIGSPQVRTDQSREW